jgi:hypothetical protein
MRSREHGVELGADRLTKCGTELNHLGERPRPCGIEGPGAYPLWAYVEPRPGSVVARCRHRRWQASPTSISSRQTAALKPYRCRRSCWPHCESQGRSKPSVVPHRGRRSAFAASVINCYSPLAQASRSSRGTSSAALTRDAKRPEYGRSRFMTRAGHAGHFWPHSTFTRASQWRFSGTVGSHSRWRYTRRYQTRPPETHSSG